MASTHKSVAALRISGNDLVPAEVSNLLRCDPTTSRKKGEVIIGKKTGTETTARIGVWSLRSADQEPANLDQILAKLTADIEARQALAPRYRMELFCGLFMDSANEGLAISPGSLVALGQRGIALALDVYGPE
jgi:hypothetical protein